MSEAAKIIETFFEKNGLHESLKAFKAQFKRTPVIPKTSLSQLAPLSKTIIPNDHESQNKLREHLQKVDPKLLKKFVQRTKKVQEKTVQDGSVERLWNLPFFRRMVQCEKERYEQYREALVSKGAQGSVLDESRVYENEWQGENDVGYEMYQITHSDLNRVVKEVHSLKRYDINAIKTVSYPSQYYEQWEQSCGEIRPNQRDKKQSRLPPSTKFDKPDDDSFPRETERGVLECYKLRVVYDREKTGFEDERQMPIVINQVLAGRFQIVSVLGQAQFSKAIQVKDLTISGQKQRYCIKMILNNKQYLDQALDQVKILRYIRNNCDTDASSLLTINDCFYHRQHLMILTQLLKQNLFQACKAKAQYFTLPHIQNIARQICTALATLHRLHLIHCDLKPQNILFKSYSGCSVKVADMGSAVFRHDPAQFYMQTRPYRAPQVVLGCPYTDKIDIWSLGCILAELYSGQVLFESEHSVALLAKMQGIRGPWPSWMIQKGTNTSKYFSREMVLYEEMQQQGQDGKRRRTGMCRVYAPKNTNLKSRIKCSEPHFVDFLSKCLKLDPSIRMSAQEALSHPFLTQNVQDSR